MNVPLLDGYCFNSISLFTSFYLQGAWTSSVFLGFLWIFLRFVLCFEAKHPCRTPMVNWSTYSPLGRGLVSPSSGVPTFPTHRKTADADGTWRWGCCWVLGRRCYFKWINTLKDSNDWSKLEQFSSKNMENMLWSPFLTPTSSVSSELSWWMLFLLESPECWL